MRFVTFVPGAAADRAGPPLDSVETARVGLLLGDTDGGEGRVVDLAHPAVAQRLGLSQDERPRSLLAMLEQGIQGWVSRLGELPDGPPDGPPAVPLSAVRLLAPLPRPGKIVGAAFNYTDALAERGTPPPAEPVTFVRSGSTVIGPDEPIVLPPDVGHVTYEAELAVVIGRRALAVDTADAMACVAGYTIHNDVSGSDLVRRDGGNFVRGKNLPASAPLGPWFVTADEIADPYSLAIRLDIDGRVLQDGSTRNMLHDIATLISHVSRLMPLDPGDVIATGTPAGVAAAHVPPAWLRPGTRVDIQLAGIGRLGNPVIAGEPFLR